ncbi:hypothetical protein PF005_g6680 [Phytophthora fragariae]|uniref:Uncharacterized protein n=2 Tax=Phytophthora fragariae TaxID=53985 RepID=A0A6A3YNX8_9STRA|nr:hypothetical protein PF003_g110 [Phytophthora fragariae]KAE8947005.1 hypothetical protein PF009_g3379 [Phytophthora fragariae]KAE9022605.1 hypothetical protein PF011_g4381 [Phytophthora fragariae]KAE9124448.1 hypothetical protein PF010_g5994 [Phytophthora fragariae]KAE9127996.1 hypothetical protein PF007_g5424 [Phytophthora fragariae]
MARIRLSPREKAVAAATAALREVDFPHLWRQLWAAGWTDKKQTGLPLQWRYTTPDGTKVFYAEAELMEHGLKTGFLDTNVILTAQRSTAAAKTTSASTAVRTTSAGAAARTTSADTAVRTTSAGAGARTTSKDTATRTMSTGAAARTMSTGAAAKSTSTGAASKNDKRGQGGQDDEHRHGGSDSDEHGSHRSAAVGLDRHRDGR